MCNTCSYSKISHQMSCAHGLCIDCFIEWTNMNTHCKMAKECPVCQAKYDMSLLENFKKFDGVILRKYDYHLLFDKDCDGWITNFELILNCLVWNHSCEFPDGKMDITIGNQKIIFETPSQQCQYISSGDYFQIEGEESAQSTDSLEKSPNQFMKQKYMKLIDICGTIFKKGRLTQEYNYGNNPDCDWKSIQLPHDVSFSNGFNKYQLLNRKKYQCQFLFSLSFIRTKKRIFPEIKLLYLKCQPIPEYSFLLE